MWIKVWKEMIDTVDELFQNYDFEDLFIKMEENNWMFDWKKEANLSKWWKIYLRLKLSESFIDDFEKSSFYQDKFSYSVKYKNDIFFRIARNWNKFTIRKLWYTFDFYETYITDPVLFSFVDEVLLQEYNKTLLISWRTWSWKTTFILSLLNMLNEYNYEKILSKQIIKILKKILTSKKINIKIEQNNIMSIIEDYLNEDEKSSLSTAVWSFLEQIKIKSLLETYNWGTVYTIEKPIEYYFETDDFLYYNQNEVDSSTAEKANDHYIKLVDIALQSNPSIIYISEIKNRVEYERFLDTIYVWPAVIASNHSNSVFQNLKRITSISTNEKEVKSKIVMWVWWLINIKRHKVIWDKIFLSSYEILKMYKERVKWWFYSNSEDVFINQMKIELKSDYYYIPHELSLLYNVYLNYLKWKSFILTEYKPNEILSLLSKNEQWLKELYKINDESIKFLENKLVENYEKYKEFLI